MKKLTSAVLILIASSAAVAAELEAASNAPLVLAYHQGPAQSTVLPSSEYKQADAERVLETTLDVVSASLSVELDSFSAPQLPINGKRSQ